MILVVSAGTRHTKILLVINFFLFKKKNKPSHASKKSVKKMYSFISVHECRYK